jgi:hypothetical protein
MRTQRTIAGFGAGFKVIIFLAFLPSQILAQESVLMNHNNLARTGANLSEKLLTASNVNSASFGKLWSYSVGGQVYAQPLYVTGVTIPGLGKKNILYVADMHNDIYAFDADDLSKANSPYWKVSYGNTVPANDPQIGVNYTDIRGEIGILGTPAIDITNNAIYFVTKTKNGGFVSDTLRALDLSTGLPKFGGAQIIQATVPGNGDGGSTVTFTSPRHNQRCALMISNGIVYICYSSYGDFGLYHGWVLGYNITNINQQRIKYCTTPNSQSGAIWMSGLGPSIDASGNIYLATCTGVGKQDMGESVLKLQPDLANGTLKVLDFWTPFNRVTLDQKDLDLGICGTVLIPGSNVILTGGKEGAIYLLDETNLGGFNSSSDHILQGLSAIPGGLMGSPVIWGDNPSNPSTALTYWWCGNDILKAFRFDYNSRQLATTAFATGPATEKPNYPGCMMSLSANGHTPGSAILWCSYPTGNAVVGTVGGILRAFNANTLTEIWNSTQAPGDAIGSFAKFVAPTVTNGKVYMATFSGTVNVFGLFNALPIVYQDFSGARKDSEVELHWTTSTEQNNAYFEVQRSSDGINFVTIGTVNSLGNSSTPTEYNFDDMNPVNGLNFYRLKQVSLDSTYSFSATITIKIDFGTTFYFQILPNPAVDVVTISCYGLKSGDAINIQMFNSGGTQVYRAKSVSTGGNDRIEIRRTRSMFSGVYVIRIILPDGSSKEEQMIWGS